jgi:hypothetical protein
MVEPTKAFTVLDLLPLVAETIKERLEQLREMQQTEAKTGLVNKQASRELLELLSLAVKVVEAYQRFAGIKVS